MESMDLKIAIVSQLWITIYIDWGQDFHTLYAVSNSQEGSQMCTASFVTFLLLFNTCSFQLQLHAVDIPFAVKTVGNDACLYVVISTSPVGLQPCNYITVTIKGCFKPSVVV